MSLAFARQLHPTAPRVSVGDILGRSEEEKRAYADRLNAAINGLSNDIKAFIVYRDPVELRSRITELRALQDTGIEYLPGTTLRLTTYIAQLEGEAVILERSAQGKTAGQVRDEIAFAKIYESFKLRWQAKKKEFDEAWWIAGYWETFQAFEAEFRRYETQFKNFTGRNPNFTLVTVDEVDNPNPSSFRTILILGVLGIAGYLLYQNWDSITSRM